MKFIFEFFKPKKGSSSNLPKDLLSSLPAEMLTKVLHFLDRGQLAKAQRISKLYDQIIKNDKYLLRLLENPEKLTTYNCKFMLIGHSESKKSSLLRDFSSDARPLNFAMDFKIMEQDFRPTILKVQAWDTAGQERYAGITYSQLETASGFLLVFNLENSITFDAIASWHAKAQEIAPNTPIVLIGTVINPQNIAVDTHAIDTFVAANKLTYIEVNINNESQIQQAFKTLGQLVIERGTSNLPKLEVPKP
jgi:small GTP-binding protein